MPVFTPGSNPRRLPAAANRRESRFLSSSRRDGSRRRRRAAWRGGEDTNAPFSSRSRPTRARGSVAFATVVRYLLEREDGEAETVRRRARNRKNEKTKNKTPLARLRRRRRARLAFVAVRTETNHRLRNDRGMPVFTPGSNPRRLPAAARRRGSCVCIDHPATNAPRVSENVSKNKLSLLLSRFICIFPLRTSRPRRGASLKCGPLSKRAPIAGVLRPLLQVTFCERAANETRVASSTRRGVFLRRRMTKKKRKTALAAPRTAAEGPGPAEVFFSRKMVNILNVDRHRQSVAWIK